MAFVRDVVEFNLSVSTTHKSNAVITQEVSVNSSISKAIQVSLDISTKNLVNALITSNQKYNMEV